MPFVEQDDVGGFVSEPLLPKEAESPGFGKTLGAAFRMENDVFAAYDLATRDRGFKPDANFNSIKRLKDFDGENRTSLYDNYKENFIGVRSEEEFQSILGRINKEQADRETLEAAGAGGVVASLAAGILSPTMFLPFIGTGRGLKAIAGAAAWGGIAGAAQELPLQMAQETRTMAESGFAIAASTVMGGLLGSAVQVLRPGELDRLVAGLERDAGMASTKSGQAIPSSGGSLGAAGTMDEYAGALKGGAANKIADWLGPVTRVINQESSRTMSWAMSQLADAGLRMEGNARGVATSIGGTVESRVKTYMGSFAQVTEGLDGNYAKYVFGEGNVPGLAPNVRAAIAGSMDAQKLSKHEFKEEISRALREGDVHTIPEVAAVAREIRAKIFDPILREAQAAGIYKNIDVLGDTSYLHRVYNHESISANTNEFVEVLTKHYAEKLNAQYGEQLAAIEARQARDTQTIEDLVRPKEELDALREQLKAEIKGLNEGRNQTLVDAEDRIATLRSNARLAAEKQDNEARKAFLSDARQIERSMGPELADLRAQRSAKTSRMQSLSRAAVALEERQLKKLEQIEKIEGLNERQLMQVARAGQRILNKIDDVSDKELDRMLKDLQGDFFSLAKQLDKGEGKIAKLLENEQSDIASLLRAEEGVQNTTGKMSDVARDIEMLDTIDRRSVRASITEALDEVNRRTLNQIEKRLIRENKLIEAAAKLDPAEATRRIDALKGMSKERRTAFIERVRAQGGDAIDLDARTADFTSHARQLAETVKDKIMATNVRTPLNDVMAAERGAELARVLDIPSSKIEKFLENDVERVLRTYLRTLPADIEIKKKFGDVNGTEIFTKVTEELNNKIELLKEQSVKEKWSETKYAKEQQKLNDTFRDHRRDLEVVIGRLRGTHGLPDNPDGMAYRMARTVMNLNVLRLMGGTLIASIPDAARPIQRYGLTRTFRDGFVPLITNFKQIQVSAREAKLAGAALDAILHTRSQSVHDVMDDLGRHSKFERGVEYATNKMGAVALFDYWTTAMKQFSSSVIITKLTDSLDIVVGGAKATAKESKEAIDFLAAKGLTGETADNIYAQLNNGKGGERVNGVLMPNTEAWTDLDAQRAFRSAIVSEVDNTIITPGVERPVWMTSSTLGRVLGQFKSFGMSSTFKVLNAGLQQRDMAFFNGTMVSLALGALSYYLSSVVAGGQSYEKMLKAGPGKFADEAINRSGLLGVFSEVQRFGERIPATQPFMSFSGDRTSRRGGDDIMDVLLGPTGGAAKSAAKVLQNLDQPTRSTLHEARTLAPFQNLLYWRQLLDQIEAASGLPERRN